MNFLAHLYLSGDNPDVKLGNFIGDFVKGKNITQRFERDIANGICLHREIDWFTDQHPVVRQSKDRLRTKYRHYAGVIVDIFYDHFLAKNWNHYSPQPLHSFAEEFYNLLQQHEVILPQEVKHLMPYMINGNWLVNYAHPEGIHRALSGMARRTKFDSKMDEASVDLKQDYNLYENEFAEFFPLLMTFCSDWLHTN